MLIWVRWQARYEVGLQIRVYVVLERKEYGLHKS